MIRPQPAALGVGVVLIALAGLVYADAARLTGGTTYGIGPEAMPMVVAVFLVALGIGHIVAAFRDGLPVPEATDLGALAWVGAGLAGLMLAIGLGLGFVLGMTLLFALTARAFGRRALVVDGAIGAGLGLAVYLVFSQLLSLSLPQGPLERLFV